MSDLILMILGGILIPTLLYALGCFIWYKLWPRAIAEKCKIVREDDSFAIYDDYFHERLIQSDISISRIIRQKSISEKHLRTTWLSTTNLPNRG